MTLDEAWSCLCGSDSPGCACYGESPGCCGAYNSETCRGCPVPGGVAPCEECEGGFIRGGTPDCVTPCDACATTGWVRV